MSQNAVEFEQETVFLDTLPAMPNTASAAWDGSRLRGASVHMVRKDRISGTVFIQDQGALHRVACARIRVLRAYGNYVEVRTHLRRFMLRNSLTDVLTQLNDPRFVQVNRSIVVNIDRVVRVDRDVVQVDEDLITLSRLCRPAVLQCLSVLNN